MPTPLAGREELFKLKLKVELAASSCLVKIAFGRGIVRPTALRSARGTADFILQELRQFWVYLCIV